MSTQAPTHKDCPSGQLPVIQVLSSQISPSPQAWLQPPQWSALLARSTQRPSQSTSGAWHISEVPEVSCDGCPSSPEQAAKPGMPKRIAPRSSHLGRELSLQLDDRMVKPFMMFI
jgi:hypothetical protein